MAYDEGLATLLRDDLADHYGLSEKRMFGGLCFLLHGNMLCGVHKGGGMFRVGKDNETEALAIEGARPMDFTRRKMGGMIDVDDDLMADDARRAAVLALALDFVAPLPAK
ncbi:MAG: TfoX/Sxy family protein [Shimia thalassica]|uniref:TfoX/Sxy family protein n=1 Tax=Shimia thalassica TaxID=1715693 RepID=UPI0032968A69